MEAKDLRIGNLFIEKHSGQIIDVIELKENGITFTGKFPYEWRAEPIPLSEEWLLKFGLKQLKEFYDDIEKAWYYGDHELYIVYNKGEYFLGLEHQDFHKEIKHVHKLQNIVYDLFDIELTLNQ